MSFDCINVLIIMSISHLKTKLRNIFRRTALSKVITDDLVSRYSRFQTQVPGIHRRENAPGYPRSS